MNDGSQALTRRVRRVRRNQRLDEDLIPLQNLIRVLFLRLRNLPAGADGDGRAAHIGSWLRECAACAAGDGSEGGDYEDQCHSGLHAFSSPDEIASTTRSGPSSARCAASAASRPDEASKTKKQISSSGKW